VASARTAAFVSIATGILLELGIHVLSGRREAWDSPQYWTVGLPLAAVVALLLGFLSRGTAWRWSVLVVPSQVTTMMVRSGEISGLWPLMLILASILSAPFVVAAWIGSRLRRRDPVVDLTPSARSPKTD
jgi:hypothetical protein